MKYLNYFAMLLLLFLFAPSSVKAVDTVKVQLKWYHQAQFAGFYVAKEKNFYSNAGLDVEFEQGGPGISISQSLIDGRADFAVSSPEDVIQARSQGKSIKAISAIYRKSAVVFLSKKDSGIIKPGDFKDKTIAVKSNKGLADFEFQFFALMKNMNVDISKVTFTPYDPDYKSFVDGSVDITPAYYTGGLIKLKSRGTKVNIIYPGDFRVRFYSDTLITTDHLINSNPDLVKRFVKATLKGWQYAINNVEASVPFILKYAKIKDKTLQTKMLEAAHPLVFTGEDTIGWMKLEDWEHMHKILVEQKIIETPVQDLNALFTTEFIN